MLVRFRLGLIFLAAGLLLIILAPFQLLGIYLLPPLARGIPVFFHRCLLKLFGVRLHIEGKLEKGRPLLIAANHVSWLDIVVMGAVAPLSFVAKIEMAKWPLFGQLAWLQRTVFVQRQDRRKSADQANDIAQRMANRETMVLFPEATTSDGLRLIPFKTALFEAVKIALIESKVEKAYVQPVAICYTRLHGLRIGLADMPHVAWPGEVGIGEHLIPLVAKGALDVTVRIGPTITFTEKSHRKTVAMSAHSTIRELILLDSRVRSR